MKLFLVGYMGSGKSTIGKTLASKLNLDFYDLDKYIENKEKREISFIFKEDGELSFRKLESKYLRTLLDELNSPYILSLGGGTPVYYDNIDLVNETGLSIYLRGKPATLTNRLINTNRKRPLVARFEDEKELQTFIAKHLFERNPFYTKSKIIVDIDGKNINEVLDEIAHNIILYKKDGDS